MDFFFFYSIHFLESSFLKIKHKGFKTFWGCTDVSNILELAHESKYLCRLNGKFGKAEDSLPLQKRNLFLGSAEEENPLPRCEHTSISYSRLYIVHAYFALARLLADKH